MHFQVYGRGGTEHGLREFVQVWYEDALENIDATRHVLHSIRSNYGRQYCLRGETNANYSLVKEEVLARDFVNLSSHKLSCHISHAQ